MKNCIFCKMVRGEVEAEGVLFQDNTTLVLLDKDWAVKGHTLVVWKAHVENMSDLSREEFANFS